MIPKSWLKPGKTVITTSQHNIKMAKLIMSMATDFLVGGISRITFCNNLEMMINNMRKEMDENNEKEVKNAIQRNV